MDNTPKRNAVLVGLFVVFGIIVLIAGVLMIGSLNKTFESKIKLVTVFNDVNGLKKGNYVWYSGVKIGTISEMNFYGLSKVAVTLKIDKEVQEHIRKDAQVKLSSDGFIGNKIVVILGGSEKSEPVNDGDTLIMAETLSMEEMLATLQENNKNIKDITDDVKVITSNLAAGKGTIGKLLNDDEVYNNITDMTASLRDAAEEAKKVTKSFAGLEKDLHKEGTLFNELTTDTVVFESFKASILKLQQIADSANVFLAEIKAASTDTTSTLGVLLNDKETGDNIKSIISNLEKSSEKLDVNLEAMQHSWPLKKYFKKQEKEEK